MAQKLPSESDLLSITAPQSLPSEVLKPCEGWMLNAD